MKKKEQTLEQEGLISGESIEITDIDTGLVVEKITENYEASEADITDSDSLLADNTETTTEVATTNVDDEEEKRRLIYEHNQRVMQTPEYKAYVVYENYIRTCGRILTGPEKRRLRKSFLRDAKKGRFDYLFDPEKIKKREERAKAKFDKLNKPVVHTENDLSPETKEKLLEMAEATEVPAFDKNTGKFIDASV